MPVTESVRKLIEITQDPQYLPNYLKELYDFIIDNGVVSSYDYHLVHPDKRRKYINHKFYQLHQLGLVKRTKQNIENREGVSGYEYVYWIE